MTAVRASLEAKAPNSTRRSAPRRKLSLQAHGSAASGATDVLILDVSTTGLLLKTAGNLTKGETIELGIPEMVGVRAVVKWASGQLFGCQFKDPISTAAVSAALLRAPYAPPSSTDRPERPDMLLSTGRVEEPGSEGDLPAAAKMRWIIALALLSWAAVAGVMSLAWKYFS